MSVSSIGQTAQDRPWRRAARGLRQSAMLCVLCGVGLSLALPAGCVARRTVGQDPHLVLGTGGYSSSNHPLVSDLVVRALPRIVAEYPPEGGDGEVLLHLPAGMTYSQSQGILDRLAAVGVTARRAGRGDGPAVYHIGRIWRRGGEAKVDIIRPVFELGLTNGWYPMQAVTVELTGGLGTWRVSGTRSWAVGTVEPPSWADQPVETQSGGEGWGG